MIKVSFAGSNAIEHRPATKLVPIAQVPCILGLHLGTPESGSLPSQPIHPNFGNNRGHQKGHSTQCGDTPGSLSYLDSPIASPNHPVSHAQISDILKSGKHASLPVAGPSQVPANQATRRREVSKALPI